MGECCHYKNNSECGDDREKFAHRKREKKVRLSRLSDGKYNPVLTGKRQNFPLGTSCIPD